MDNFWDAVSGFSYFEYVIAAFALMIVTLIIQARLKSVYKKYSEDYNSQGMTGAEAAQLILEKYDIHDVQIQMIGNELGDNYNPRTKVLSLSPDVYNGASVAAVGIAAHEVGHAIQHHKGYIPVKLRTALVPVANIGSRFSFIIIMIGLLINSFANTNAGYYLALVGLAFFLFAVLFSLVTLPVEFNASNRAKKILADTIALDDEDLKGVKKVLGAAAMTYVASLASALLTLLRMLSIVAGSRRNN